MKQNFLILAGLSVIAVFPATTHAAKTVTSPYVSEGETEFEWKGGYATDDDEDDAWEMEASAAYGVTSFWETEIAIAGEDAGDDADSEFSALIWENKFQLAPEGAFWVDPGLKIEYEHNLQGGPDEIAADFILAKQIGKWGSTANFEIGRAVGEDSDDEFEYGFAYALTYEYAEDLAFGAEWYSDFGNLEDDSDDFDEQGHQFGPVLYGEAFGALDYEAGILAGLSESAPDAEIKLVLGYEF